MMKKLIFSGMALATLLSLSVAQAQTVGQDLKGAGHDTANAGRTVGHDTVHGTKVAAHDTAHGTKVATHKTVHATKTGYHKTANGTKHVVHKVDGQSSTHPQ